MKSLKTLIMSMLSTITAWVGQSFKNVRAATRRFLYRPAVEKFGVSFFLAITLAFLRTKTLDQFLDMTVWCVIYLNWCFFVLPSLKDKLTLTMVWNVAYVIVALFFADGLFYGMYGHAKRYFLEQQIAMNSAEMKSWAFFMNVIRICCMLFCVVSSSTQFVNSLSPTKSPKKYNLRNR